VLEEDAWSNVALDSALKSTPLKGPDRGLCTQLLYGTLTWLRTIDAVLGKNVKGRLDRVEPQVACILRVAIYQLGWLDRVPDHAAVDQAVKHARKVRGRAAGFVNGVLRSAIRGREDWPEIGGEFRPGDNPHTLARRWSLPDWLCERWTRQFGIEEAFLLGASIAAAPPLTLRTRSAEAASLGQAGSLAPHALRLDKWSAPADRAVREGAATVQDEGAQLVTCLAHPAAGERVLDACAGQGGKALHIADLLGDSGQVVAVDPAEHRLERMPESARILTVRGDLQKVAPSLGDPFDLVVVDAPCSGLGVLRRHPEGRWTRREADVTTQAALQRELLDAAARVVKPGGRLVYAVCTTTPEEGTRQIESLLSRHRGFQLDLDGGDPEVPWTQLRREQFGYITLPHLHDCDGFFLTRLALAP
jgi:16S rRNA (cytosine967-C5)-methyltransferase